MCPRRFVVELNAEPRRLYCAIQIFDLSPGKCYHIGVVQNNGSKKIPKAVWTARL